MKTKATIQFSHDTAHMRQSKLTFENNTAQLICVIVFSYADCCFLVWLLINFLDFFEIYHIMSEKVVNTNMDDFTQVDISYEINKPLECLKKTCNHKCRILLNELKNATLSP